MTKKRQAKQKKSISFLGALANLFSSFGAIVGEIKDIAALELQLAKRSLVVIFWLTLGIGFLLISAWTLLLAAIGSALVLLVHLSWLSVFLSLALFNILIIMCLLLWIAKARKRLTFPETRNQLHFFKENYHEKTHHSKATEKD